MHLVKASAGILGSRTGERKRESLGEECCECCDDIMPVGVGNGAEF